MSFIWGKGINKTCERPLCVDILTLMTQGRTFLLVQGVTHFAFMKSKLKILMGFNNPKCHIEFNFGQFQITPLCNCSSLLISWAITYTSRYKILHFLQLSHFATFAVRNRRFWRWALLEGRKCFFLPIESKQAISFFCVGIWSIIIYSDSISLTWTLIYSLLSIYRLLCTLNPW